MLDDARPLLPWAGSRPWTRPVEQRGSAWSAIRSQDLVTALPKDDSGRSLIISPGRIGRGDRSGQEKQSREGGARD